VVWPQNHSDDFRWFDHKISGNVFHQFGLKTGGDGFFRFGLKTGGGFLVEPQNQGGGGFPGLSLKTGSSVLVIWVSKPSGLRFVGCATKPTEGGRRGTRVEILQLAWRRSKSG
jgi:hypothetical protein